MIKPQYSVHNVQIKSSTSTLFKTQHQKTHGDHACPQSIVSYKLHSCLLDSLSLSLSLFVLLFLGALLQLTKDDFQSVLRSLSTLMFINIISSHLMECNSMLFVTNRIYLFSEAFQILFSNSFIDFIINIISSHLMECNSMLFVTNRIYLFSEAFQILFSNSFIDFTTAKLFHQVM